MLLSALFVRFRDIQPIWDVATTAAFYATPILYPIERVEIAWARELIMYNPLAVVVQEMRHSVFDPSAPSAVEAIGGYAQLCVPVGISLGLLVLGFVVFNRTAPTWRRTSSRVPLAELTPHSPAPADVRRACPAVRC